MRCTCPDDWQGIDHTAGCRARARLVGAGLQHVISAEEAVAAIFALDDAPLTCVEVPEFIDELARRGYKICPITDEK